jgi:hypothetical protein
MPNSRISRRDFLKIMGASATVFVFGGVFGSGLFLKKESNSQQQVASAQSAGSWSLGPNTLIVAIHAGLLPSGKIFYLAGSGFHTATMSGPFKSAILDPTTGSQDSSTQNEDLFCAGNTTLPNGNILVAGGTLKYDTATPDGKWEGLQSAYEVDSSTGVPNKVASMSHGRWYPTCITLSDGKVLTVLGFDQFGCYNRLTEIYDPAAKSWSISYDPGTSSTYCVGYCSSQAGAGSPCYGSTSKGVGPLIANYPRMHLLPNGVVAVCGQNAKLYTWNPGTGRWRSAGTTAYGKTRNYGTSVLLPLQNTIGETGMILVAGGAPSSSSAATNNCEILTPISTTSLSAKTISPMAYPRRFLNPVILPNGQVGMFHGTTNTSAGYVLAAETFDPVSGNWTTLASASVRRGYHGVALLMADGRVWTAGHASTKTSSQEFRTEIFSPSYVSATRPTISDAPTASGGYGGAITIPTPDASNIQSASMVKLSSVSHHYNTDQRLIWLQIQNSTSSSVTVSAPLNGNLAPPGYYMIHVLNASKIPSISKIIKFPS